MPAITPVDTAAFTPNWFAGKVLLVTGAAVGSIGGCTATRAAREGASVFCVDRKVPQLHQTVAAIDEIGKGRAAAFDADDSNSAKADRMVADCVMQFGQLDLALNAVGVMDGTDPAGFHSSSDGRIQACRVREQR